MKEKGWRSLTIENAHEIRLSNGNLVVTDDDSIRVPLEQLKSIMICSPQSSLSLALMSELVQNNIMVVFCDKTYKPVGTVMGLYPHHNTSGNIIVQSRWSRDVKDLVWQEIVQQKIAMESALLQKNGLNGSQKLETYKANVLLGDTSNREGQAARLYFNCLFGKGFKRFDDDATNHALNYAYVIMLTEVCRIIVSHGYHTALGIKHCGAGNPYNLACDILEPFRAFADEVVYKNGDRPLDFHYKRELLQIFEIPAMYNGKRCLLKDVMERFTLDVLKKMNRFSHQLGVIYFGR